MNINVMYSNQSTNNDNVVMHWIEISRIRAKQILQNVMVSQIEICRVILYNLGWSSSLNWKFQSILSKSILPNVICQHFAQFSPGETRFLWPHHVVLALAICLLSIAIFRWEPLWSSRWGQDGTACGEIGFEKGPLQWIIDSNTETSNWVSVEKT